MTAEFLVDRSLGRYQVPNAIRWHGYQVHTLWSVYGLNEQTLSDVDYLRDAGRNGWVVLTADMKIRWRPHELEVIPEEAVRIFALASGNLRGRDQVRRFVDNLSAIVSASEQGGPYIYAVYPQRIERRWPIEGGSSRGERVR